MATDRIGRTIGAGDRYLLGGIVRAISGSEIVLVASGGQVVHCTAGDLVRADDALVVYTAATAPTGPLQQGQLWYDTTDRQLKQYTGSTWVMLGPSAARFCHIDAGESARQLSATFTFGFFTPPADCFIEQLRMISDTATTSSSGNEWRFGLRNVTAGQELFSGNVGTFTALGGVGGGADFAVDTAYVLNCDQNNAVGAGAVLRFTATKLGTATTIPKLQFRVKGYYRGV